jgi:regulatory protein
VPSHEDGDGTALDTDVLAVHGMPAHAAVDGEGGQGTTPDHARAARAIALRMLTAAPRSRAQLSEAMVRKGIPEPVIDQVLDRFTQVGLVDDATLAADLVRSRHTSRGLTGRALLADLRRRGIPPDLADAAMAELGTDEIDTTARTLAARKLAQTRGLPTEVRLRRTLGMLARKGHTSGRAAAIVRELLAEEGSTISSVDEQDTY